MVDVIDMDMESTGITLREVLYSHKDSHGNQLFDAVEKTKNGGTYRVMFDGA
jgi:hypothetical protein